MGETLARKILLADDDLDFVEIARAILENSGYEVTAAQSAEEAFQKAKEVKFDLIIADLMMEQPDSGFTLCHRLKSDPELSSVPVLLLTAVQRKSGIKFSPTSKGGSEWIKADDYADKPVPPEQLLSRVRHLINRPVA